MLKRGFLILSVVLLMSGCTTMHRSPAEISPAVPKNVIVLVGDGMGVGQIEIGRVFEHGKNGRMFLQSLPHVGLVQTFSANNRVTDSAAAATAIATGVKTNNRMLGMTPDGDEVSSILDLCQKNGKKVGVISTNTATDATPAGFTVSIASRDSQAAAARQLLKQEVDVIMGGGKKYFGAKKQDGDNLIPRFKAKGYTFAENREELANADENSRILGLFNRTYMNYKLDREENKSLEPSLREMTSKGIEILSKGKNGFFLMSEGARIDHASHAADVTGVWKEMVEFDETVEYAVTWAKKAGDTLVIVLADHETMSFGASEGMDIQALKRIEVSPEYMAKQLKKNSEGTAFTRESVKSVFEKYAAIKLTDKEVDALNRKVVKGGKFFYDYKIGWEIGSIIAEKYHCGIMSSSSRRVSKTGGHTGNMVPVFAFGTGAERFEGVLDNTQIFEIMKDLMKIK